jgi:5,5'-dehydrodivanillate O-demethylase oxygenase subunit
MLSVEDNKLLTEVGPGTPMGSLLRWYWQPVCALDELLQSPFRTKELRIMGEDLVAFCDRRGRPGLIAKHCVHRRASLAYGIVEEDGLRCAYHGWKYDQDGRCIDQPFEDTTHPEERFQDKCSIVAYPVQVLAGLVWAYMGPRPAPLLPSWEPMVWDNCVRDIGIVELPCSWLQCQENTLDPVHTEWLHSYAGGYYRQLLGGEEPSLGHERQHLKIAFDQFEHGIIKRRLMIGQDEDSEAWKQGHPMLFPNVLFSGNPYQNQMQFRVPIDDSRTRHYTLHTWRAAEGSRAPSQDVIPARQFALQDQSGNYQNLDVFFAQDYMVWATQGPIARRDLEKLGQSDRGVILFRQMLMDQIDLVRRGQEPSINIFRDQSWNQRIDLPIENVRPRGGRYQGHGQGEGGLYMPTEPGVSRDKDKIEAVIATWASLAPALAESKP